MVAFWRKRFDLSREISRWEFLLVLCLVLPLSLVLWFTTSLAMGMTFSSLGNSAPLGVYSLVGIAFLPASSFLGWILASACAQRLNTQGRSKKELLWLLVPGANLLMLARLALES